MRLGDRILEPPPGVRERLGETRLVDGGVLERTHRQERGDVHRRLAERSERHQRALAVAAETQMAGGRFVEPANGSVVERQQGEYGLDPVAIGPKEGRSLPIAPPIHREDPGTVETGHPVRRGGVAKMMRHIDDPARLDYGHGIIGHPREGIPVPPVEAIDGDDRHVVQGDALFGEQRPNRTPAEHLFEANGRIHGGGDVRRAACGAPTLMPHAGQALLLDGADDLSILEQDRGVLLHGHHGEAQDVMGRTRPVVGKQVRRRERRRECGRLAAAQKPEPAGSVCQGSAVGSRAPIVARAQGVDGTGFDRVVAPARPGALRTQPHLPIHVFEQLGGHPRAQSALGASARIEP